jgi:hypothetical protein
MGWWAGGNGCMNQEAEGSQDKESKETVVL